MWHEARRSEKKVHDIMDAARKRAERRAVFFAKRRGDPQQQLRITGTRCRMYVDQAMYQATQDQHGLIPWNGKKDNLIDRFDGRALLDFIRESDKSRRHEKTEEEEELEELVNFERYRDLIKRRRRGFSDEQGLLDVDHEDETKTGSSTLDRERAGQGVYAQVGYSYDGGARASDDEDAVEDEEGDLESSSGDSEDEETDCIGRDHGVQRFGWLTHMDKKVKAAERRQKEAAKGDTAMKLSRKERRKASQYERDAARRFISSDPYRESDSYSYRKRSRRSRSRSRSPRSRRHGYSDRARKSDSSRVGKIEYITEFGGDNEADDKGRSRGYSPPPSPPPCQVDTSSRPAPGRILEALHGDPAASVGGSLIADAEKGYRKDHKVTPLSSTSSAIAKLSKPPAAPKAQQAEKKETPQERLKRIMSKQLNKQIKKDTVSEMLKKREQERQRQEKLAETRRFRSRSRSSSRSRSRSRSPSRYYDRR
ncbi:CLK4-associating serine/arginine rich protein isoform X1 [Selaginella moellendorffii]|uniref:CLK4-associating serine/arginine rich protein isoform X1 n=1 Tax=Selaginella moellendorffii TaxID=88036 RepID=UPI000D1CEEEA|nr:CLK4-associating serine/arginine rich protein isoform X1 [Selaginella moellendorffii]|eukprot:XP_024519082.1 CLK4-associating serine/arginine rich protein isoform X1 [Selaginella moellendorffii]